MNRLDGPTATHVHFDVTSREDWKAGPLSTVGDGRRVRKTKELRREEILEAALAEFAELGLNGASVEDIARRVGISQPHVFRLFSTKKTLFKAVVARCFRETLEAFQLAAKGESGREALDAIGKMYADRLWNDRCASRQRRRPSNAVGGHRRRGLVGLGRSVRRSEAGLALNRC